MAEQGNYMETKNIGHVREITGYFATRREVRWY